MNILHTHARAHTHTHTHTHTHMYACIWEPFFLSLSFSSCLSLRIDLYVNAYMRDLCINSTTSRQTFYPGGYCRPNMRIYRRSVSYSRGTLQYLRLPCETREDSNFKLVGFASIYSGSLRHAAGHTWNIHNALTPSSIIINDLQMSR